MANEFFEYWNLPSSDNEKTKIVRCYKSYKYLVFVRDDGRECKYDLSSGEVIGFRNKPVKSLATQLKDLTCEKLIEITQDPVYKQYLLYVWHRYRKGKAWVFLKETLPLFINYEQYFSTGFTNIQRSLMYGYNEIPKGLFKLCNTYNLQLTNQLASTYIENPDAFNMLEHMTLNKCSKEKMIEAITYGCRKQKKHIILDNPDNTVNPYDLTVKTSAVRMTDNRCLAELKELDRDSSYFNLLISHFGYNSKLLISYIDAEKIKKKFSISIFKYLYGYADLMNQLYVTFDKYPKNLNTSHAKACDEYNKLSIYYDEKEFGRRNVLDYECEIDGYKFIYPRSTKEIQAEARSQHNCVATYIDRVLHEDCHIMFMRPVNNLNDSYITLEIRNNKIVQAKRKFNKSPSTQENEIIKKWNKKYENYKLNCCL